MHRNQLYHNIAFGLKAATSYRHRGLPKYSHKERVKAREEIIRRWGAVNKQMVAQVQIQKPNSNVSRQKSLDTLHAFLEMAKFSWQMAQRSTSQVVVF